MMGMRGALHSFLLRTWGFRASASASTCLLSQRPHAIPSPSPSPPPPPRPPRRASSQPQPRPPPPGRGGRLLLKPATTYHVGSNPTRWAPPGVGGKNSSTLRCPRSRVPHSASPRALPRRQKCPILARARGSREGRRAELPTFRSIVTDITGIRAGDGKTRPGPHPRWVSP